MRNPVLARPEVEAVTLGLRGNLTQFSLLLVVTAFVGTMVGIERVVVPLLGQQVFGIASKAAILSFIGSFGFVKALSNLFAGRLADSYGRKKILVSGWLMGFPVPFMVMWAPSWWWVVFANVLLGVNQGLAWSITINSKIDLVGPKYRGLATGLNEFAGYVAVGLTALATGYIAAAYSLRPAPFYLGILFASAGLILSVFLVKETRSHAVLEANGSKNPRMVRTSIRKVFAFTSWKDKTLFTCSQAGLITKVNDGIAWGLLPLFFAASSLNVVSIGLIASAFPTTWGISQLATGVLSDKLGRKWMIASGMWIQALGISVIVSTKTFPFWLTGSVLLGLGTALVYPTLISAVSDVVNPQVRASSVGVYRLWRDLGYLVGALLVGWLADVFSVSFGLSFTAALTFLSGLLVAFLMCETLPSKRMKASKRSHGRIGQMHCDEFGDSTLFSE